MDAGKQTERKPHHSKWSKAEIAAGPVWCLMCLELSTRKRGPSILWTEWGDLLRSQSPVVPMHYTFVPVTKITMTVEFSYVIRRNVITFNPGSKWASAAAAPIHVCTAYQGEEEYNGFYVSKQNTVCNWKCHFLRSNFMRWWLDIFHLKLNSSWPCCILGFGLMSNFSQICASSLFCISPFCCSQHCKLMARREHDSNCYLLSLLVLSRIGVLLFESKSFNHN